jgi:TonB family protein
VEDFAGEGGWTCFLSPEAGIANLRSFKTEGGGRLGLKVEFLKRSDGTLLLKPPQPLSIDPTCLSLSIRVLGRSFLHRLSLIVLDYYGRPHELPLGRLDFSGWKMLQAYIPVAGSAGASSLVQDDRHYSRPAGLRIAALKLDFDPEDAYGLFYAYFEDLEATIEGPSEAVPVQEAPLPAASTPAAAEPQALAPKADPAVASSRILSELSQRIEAALVYPAAARRRGLEGSLVAEFSVEAGGKLGWARVAQSSGSDILDSAGLELLRSVFPVENDSGKQLVIRISIGYRLRPH